MFDRCHYLNIYLLRSCKFNHFASLMSFIGKDNWLLFDFLCLCVISLYYAIFFVANTSASDIGGRLYTRPRTKNY